MSCDFKMKHESSYSKNLQKYKIVPGFNNTKGKKI